MSLRKLASIQIVTEIKKHPQADSLALAKILGWQVVVRLDEVKVGEKVVYCEIDSLIPTDQDWTPPSLREKGPNFLIKTIKIRKEFSQGLVIPIIGSIKSFIDYEVGTDVTKLLKIKKWEQADLSERGGEKFPKIIDKTDELRLQSNPDLLEKMLGQPYYSTVKMDGTSATYLIFNDDFTACSKNFIKKGAKSAWLQVAEKYKLKEKLEAFPHLALQGEICGPGIQKNKMCLDEISFFVFNIIDIPTRKRLPFDQLVYYTKNVFGLEMVPIEQVEDSFNFKLVEELLERSKGIYKNTKNMREGLVFRLKDGTTSFKVINPEYLL